MGNKAKEILVPLFGSGEQAEEEELESKKPKFQTLVAGKMSGKAFYTVLDFLLNYNTLHFFNIIDDKVHPRFFEFERGRLKSRIF